MLPLQPFKEKNLLHIDMLSPQKWPSKSLVKYSWYFFLCNVLLRLDNQNGFEEANYIFCLLQGMNNLETVSTLIIPELELEVTNGI